MHNLRGFFAHADQRPIRGDAMTGTEGEINVARLTQHRNSRVIEGVKSKRDINNRPRYRVSIQF